MSNKPVWMASSEKGWIVDAQVTEGEGRGEVFRAESRYGYTRRFYTPPSIQRDSIRFGQNSTPWCSCRIPKDGMTGK